MGKIVRGSLQLLCGIMLMGILVTAAGLLMVKGMKLETTACQTGYSLGMLVLKKSDGQANYPQESVILEVPYLGYLWSYLGSREGKAAALLYMLVFVTIWIILRCWREKDRREEERWAYLWGNA